MQDEITWNPRVNTTGDDRYNVPGAIKLSGSADTGGPTRIAVGDSSGYSTTPTISEINAGSGINQVVAYIRRRMSTYNTAFSTALSLPSYLSADGRIVPADFTTLHTKLNALRAAEGYENYSFTDRYYAGNAILGTDLAHLRKALSTEPTLSCYRTNTHYYQREDYPAYGTTFGESFDTDIYAGNGKIRMPGQRQLNSDSFRRYRLLSSYRIPPWLSTCTSANYQLYVHSVSSLPADTVVLYSSNSDDHSPTTGDAANLDNDQGNMSFAVGDYTTCSVDTTEIATAAGTYRSFVLVTASERDSDDSTMWLEYLEDAAWGCPELLVS